MLIAFKREFEDDVAAGRKRQTIRPPRRDRRYAVVGETLHCYSRLRQRREKARLLGRFDCRLSAPIELSLEGAVLDGRRLRGAALEDLARRDGFESFEALLVWFDREHGLPFDGRLYRW